MWTVDSKRGVGPVSTHAEGGSSLDDVPQATTAELFLGRSGREGANEDAAHRLLNLVPTPTRECRGGSFGIWEPGYALSPDTANWARQVRETDPNKPALTVGFVGATSAGKSWLVGKLQNEEGPRPSTMDLGDARAATLQSVTSDINLYADPRDGIYYIDFEGTYGTQPFYLSTKHVWEVVQRCADSGAWESKRRQALKASVQPAVAYLMCNVVVFLTREKLVCRRALEECEEFAWAANGRVTCALSPALVIIQNCSRPSEGCFDPEQCTAAFKQAHMRNGTAQWAKYFRSIDCFCVPDEFTFCKRSGFDGELVCSEVIASIKVTLRRRLQEDITSRLKVGVQLSQLQWFPALSTLCSIINDRESVEMSSIIIRAGANGSGIGDLKSALLDLIHPAANRGGLVDAPAFRGRIDAAIGIVARFLVLREMPDDDFERILDYLLALFPCGAMAPGEVERIDHSALPVVCGQSKLFHSHMHRSSTLVRTTGASWLQCWSEWFQGGITYAWSGEFICHSAVEDLYNIEHIRTAVLEQAEEYRVEKCLQGLAREVGPTWVLRACKSLRASSTEIRHDTSRLCMICMAQGVDPGAFWRMWLRPCSESLAVCSHCYEILEQFSMISDYTALRIPDDSCAVQEPLCSACTSAVGLKGGQCAQPMQIQSPRKANHRAHPCRCVLCTECAERAAEVWTGTPFCPACDAPFQWLADERALLGTGWRAVRPTTTMHHKACGICVSR